MRTSLAWPLLVSAFCVTAASCLVDFDEFEFNNELKGTASTGVGGAASGAGGSVIGGSGPGVGGRTGAGGATTTTTGQGGMPGTASVDCGGSPCDVSGQGICCLPDGGGMAQCIAMGNCPNNDDTEITCDEPGDCPGGQCCGDFSGGRYLVVECLTDCGNDVIVCDTTADCTGNDTCQQSNFLPMGYLICR